MKQLLVKHPNVQQCLELVYRFATVIKIIRTLATECLRKKEIS